MTAAGRPATAAVKPKYHLHFTEEMKGFFTFDETEYQRGFEAGRATGSAVMFHLTIGTDDTFAFIAERGVFNLFVDAGEINGEPARHMLYRLWFSDAVGHPLTLTGFKDIRHPAAALSQFKDVWGETTTLYTKILAGHVEAADDHAAAVIGAGIIHILPLDFARQLTTFRVKGAALSGRWKAFQAFGALFMGQLWEVFQPRLPWVGRGRGRP
jgi:cholesterol oxidase